MKMKQGLSFLLSAIMVLAAGVPNGVMAAESAAIVNAGESYDMQEAFNDLPDNDTLFQQYVDGLFWGEQHISAYGNYGEDRLEGIELSVYRTLKEFVQKVASGELSSSVITLSLEALGITKTSWSASDLGVDEIVKEGQITQEAMDAWKNQNVPDISCVMAYLLADCPLDFYWYDKTETGGIRVIPPQMTARTEDGENWLLYVESGETYQFSVAAEYQEASAAEPHYTVNAALPRLALAAADSAKEIVKKYANYGDFEKLDAYREEICRLTSYNHEASEGSGVQYGNPWQLIWVFDGDDATSVVCEGYAKAFQYLCDLSTFRNSGVRCYTVTGVMAGGTGEGGHMWNIVTMEDNKNYLVDITNCDDGTIGEDNKLFLTAAKESAGGYVVSIAGEEISYRYDAAMADIYGEVLQISPTAYEPNGSGYEPFLSGPFGANLNWSLDQEGNFKIEGTGDMPSIELVEDIPWNDYRDGIKSVVVGEGITSIGELAFFNCESLSKISLPDSLELIAPAAFAYCSKLDGVEFGENLTTIEMLAFCECAGLTEVVIPAGVAHIGDGAFLNCKSLKNARFLGNCPVSQPASNNGPAFFGSTLTVHYPNNSVTGWEELIASGFGADYITWSPYCLNHVWESDYRIDTEASCTSEGSRSIHCTLCDEVKDREVIPAIGHKLTRRQAVEATCTQEGNREFYLCSVCGKVFSDAAGTAEISMADTVVRGEHKYEAVITKATTSQNGSIVQRCSLCGTVASSETIYAPKTVVLAKDSYQYTGKALTPAVTVSDESGKIIGAENYTVSYGNNKAVGTASVNIVFQGNYSGTLTKTFAINPKATSITKLKAKAKGFEVKWKKQTAQTSGYQIQYAANNKFKGAKNIKIAKNKTKSRTVSKLKAKKKYFVRIRTYKTVKGVSYYSSWSAVKQIKTK